LSKIRRPYPARLANAILIFAAIGRIVSGGTTGSDMLNDSQLLKTSTTDGGVYQKF